MQRCSLILCKAMSKTHGASTECHHDHHVWILSPGCFCHTNSIKHQETKKTSPLQKKTTGVFVGRSYPSPRVCPRLQVLLPPWHQVIGNSESTRGKSPSMNGSRNEVRDDVFLRNFTILRALPYYCNSSATKKNMGNLFIQLLKRLNKSINQKHHHGERSCTKIANETVCRFDFPILAAYYSH